MSGPEPQAPTTNPPKPTPASTEGVMSRVENWYEKDLSHSMEVYTDRAAKFIAKSTEGNLGITEEDAKGYVPVMAAAGVGLAGWALSDTLNKIGGAITRPIERLVRKIPLIGDVLGDVISTVASFTSVIVTAIAAFLTFKAFEKTPPPPAPPGWGANHRDTPDQSKAKVLGTGLIGAGAAYRELASAGTSGQAAASMLTKQDVLRTGLVDDAVRKLSAGTAATAVDDALQNRLARSLGVEVDDIKALRQVLTSNGANAAADISGDQAQQLIKYFKQNPLPKGTSVTDRIASIRKVIEPINRSEEWLNATLKSKGLVFTDAQRSEAIAQFLKTHATTGVTGNTFTEVVDAVKWLDETLVAKPGVTMTGAQRAEAISEFLAKQRAGTANYGEIVDNVIAGRSGATPPAPAAAAASGVGDAAAATANYSTATYFSNATKGDWVATVAQTLVKKPLEFMGKAATAVIESPVGQWTGSLVGGTASMVTKIPLIGKPIGWVGSKVGALGGGVLKRAPLIGAGFTAASGIENVNRLADEGKAGLVAYETVATGAETLTTAALAVPNPVTTAAYLGVSGVRDIFFGIHSLVAGKPELERSGLSNLVGAAGGDWVADKTIGAATTAVSNAYHGVTSEEEKQARKDKRQLMAKAVGSDLTEEQNRKVDELMKEANERFKGRNQIDRMAAIEIMHRQEAREKQKEDPHTVIPPITPLSELPDKDKSKHRG
ncbi:MAG: hypothetical protein SFT92_02450 [Rickettsiales bacterium]|nr:hypothetical protein [Rickettsiales bacterium]